MKDTFYFSHDYNSRSDDKIKMLIRKHGMLGYGLFWAIIEDLYNNANAMRTDYEGIAYELRTDSNIIKSIINDFDLFILNDTFFGSLSVQRRLDERNSKSSKARESALIRWSKDANAMHKECDSNAIKESIVKEIKIKYVYNDFYDLELEKCNSDENYLNFVKVIFGANSLSKKLERVLKMPEQVTFEQFKSIYQYKDKYKVSVGEYLVRMENWKDLNKKNVSVQSTLLNWIRKDKEK